ncbi:MAG: hypothetical protein LUQ25_05285, partial [Methanoregulaceae archaeon]|nr:hypothetical protein [Methanoregulaceae archaeon]
MSIPKFLPVAVILVLIGVLALLSLPPPAMVPASGSPDRSFNSPHGYVMSTHAEGEKDRGVEIAVERDGSL